MVEEDVPSMAESGGEYLMGKLNALKEQHPFIEEVRGMGLLVGLQMSDERAGAVVAECLDNGLLMNAVRPNTLRFMPPLNVSTRRDRRRLYLFSTRPSQRSRRRNPPKIPDRGRG